MFSRFFIDRPIFASVLSIMIALAGGIAAARLPVAQYPDIAPPTVEVFASYPGANSQVVADTVAAPIEQQVNGVEDMMYMSSQSANDGNYVLTVTFKAGANLNIAQVLVQNRVNLALPTLPDLVKRRGVTVKKKSPSVLQIVNLSSPNGTHDNLYLSNYATIQLRDELSRVPGVGDITYLGQRDYSMRVWLDPDRLAARQLTSTDVANAVAQQNAQVAAGQIGQPPAPKNQVFQYTMNTLGRLADPEQFSEMILKSDAAGRVVRLRDVAEIELGAQAYDQACTLDGRPSVALSIYQLPGSNALETARLTRAKMEELKKRFPDGVDYSIVYDTTPFIEESIAEVLRTLRDAVVLVALTMLVFLQNWRATLIPLIAVPVAVVGTFAAMAAFGFSVNTLTLFGLVLAIGIVVDDAIVVVEAVQRQLEAGKTPREATIAAMDQVSGPVVAIGLVLAAVFVPCVFVGGIVGQFFRQFALTIAVSTLISAFNSLTLSPALAALMLKPHDRNEPALPAWGFPALGAWLGWRYLAAFLPGLAGWGAVGAALAGAVAGWALRRVLEAAARLFFRAFDAGFGAVAAGYLRTVGGLLRATGPMLVLYAGLVWLTLHLFRAAPSGFIPPQDKGYLIVDVQLPDSASVSRTEGVMARIDDLARRTPGVAHTVAIAGQSILLQANASNFGAMYVMLEDFASRRRPELGGDALAERLQEAFRAACPEALVNVVGGPPVDGLGTAGGFKYVVEDRRDRGPATLQAAANDFVAATAVSAPEVRGAFSSFRADTPWLSIELDRTAAKAMGVSLKEIFDTLQVHFGSLYVNDFNRFGRTWQVNLQADQRFRGTVEDLKRLKVRNDRGGMTALAAVATTRDVGGPALVGRYNLYPAATVNGAAAPGVSTGAAIGALERLGERLPPGFRGEWTELALLQLQAGDTATWAFVLAVVLVFLVLAAQYESWSLPLAVILVVPMCLLSAVAGVHWAGQDVNVFTQIGFVVLVGLASKNAILIVEFAKARREAGMPRREATLEACRLRLRPILMTSFAFVLGVVPLALARGAGAEMRRALGVAVFFGMLGVTLFGVFLTPIFFNALQWLMDRRSPAAPRDAG